MSSLYTADTFFKSLSISSETEHASFSNLLKEKNVIERHETADDIIKITNTESIDHNANLKYNLFNKTTPSFDIHQVKVYHILFF